MRSISWPVHTHQFRTCLCHPRLGQDVRLGLLFEASECFTLVKYLNTPQVTYFNKNIIRFKTSDKAMQSIFINGQILNMIITDQITISDSPNICMCNLVTVIYQLQHVLHSSGCSTYKICFWYKVTKSDGNREFFCLFVREGQFVFSSNPSTIYFHPCPEYL